MPTPSKLLFLPGASGNTLFWLPVAELLTHPAAKVCIGWPGFGPTPVDPKVNGIDDLVARVVMEIDQPTALIAQSMGGVIAIRAALERPKLVTHLVLTATSGGIDISNLGAEDWRPGFLQENSQLPNWFIGDKSDLTENLSTIFAPSLLIWGDADPISPVTIGQRLSEYLPNADLHVIHGSNHALAYVHAQKVAALIDDHLARPAKERMSNEK
jgi:poly(3-hydroxyoctanoate) depolymerase